MVDGLDAIATDTAVPVPAQAPGGLFARAVARLNDLIVLVSSAALVVAGFVLTYSVASRYFFHFSTDWQDELAVFLIVGAVFMSSSAVQAMRGHVAIEALAAVLPPRVNRVRQFLVDVASFCFCAYFALKTWNLLEEAWVDNYHSGSTWGPPLWIPYSLMAVGMTLLSVQLLLQVVHAIMSRRAAGAP